MCLNCVIFELFVAYDGHTKREALAGHCRKLIMAWQFCDSGRSILYTFSGLT